jgi:hypothetical protein
MPRGNVNVRITSDTSGLSRGTRSAESDLNRLERTSKKSLEGVHKAAHLALGVTGLGGLAFGIKDVTSEAIKAEAEQAKLARAVHNAGLKWKENRKAVEDHLDALSRTSGFMKSDLSSSLANSVRTTGDLTKAFKLSGIAMDIARTKGMDLQGAQSLVARAYNGNTRGLKSLGILLTPVTTQQDKLKVATQQLSDELRNSHGANKETIRLAKEKLQALKDEAKQQDTNATRTKAIAVLEQKFQGQSSAYAKTTAGSFDRAKASLSLAEEEIGKALLPMLASAAGSVADIATKFAKHWPEIRKQIKDTVGPIFSFAKGVGEFVAHHKALADIAVTVAGIALSYKAIKKLGALTGVTDLAKGAGGLAGRLTGRGGGILAGAKPIPVYVVNEGFGGGGAGGIARTAESAAGAGGLKGALRGTAAGIGAVGGGPLAAFLSGLPVALSGGYGDIGLLNQVVKSKSSTAGGVIDAFKEKVTALSKAGDTQGLRKLAGDLRDVAAANNTLTDSKDLKKYAEQVDALASTATKQSAVVTGAFALMRRSGGKSIDDIAAAVASGTSVIKDQLGSRTEAGKEALAKNFNLAAGAVKKSMNAGVISTKDGVALINQYLRKALAEYGITGKSASHYLSNSTGDITGKGSAGVSGSGQGLAIGGYIGAPGEAGGDNVPVMLGRGEAVLNRYQQAPVEMALQNTYGMGLGDLFASVTRPHYMASGGFAGLKPGIASAARRVLARFPALSITSTTGGAHAPGSYHYLGEAADIAGPGMDQAAAWIKQTMGAGLTEGIHNPNLSIKFGKNVPSSFWGAQTWAGHANHIHLAVAGALRAAGLGSAQIKRVMARAGLGAVSGIAQGALDTVRRGARSVLSRAIGSASAGDTGGPSVSGGVSFAQLRSLWIKAGGPPGVATLMAHVAEAESSGNPNAHNASGATGLWQILGAVVPGNLYDPLVNARNAVAKYRAGGLAPWDASRSVWGQYLARGGYVGMSGGGIGGQINNITGGVHANGLRRSTEEAARKKAGAQEGRQEAANALEGHQPVHGQGRVAHRRAVARHPAALPGQAQERRRHLEDQHEQQRSRARQRSGGRQRPPVGLPDFTDTSGDVADQDFTNVEDALGDVDLHVQAGDITEAQGVSRSATIISSAVAGGFGVADAARDPRAARHAR